MSKQPDYFDYSDTSDLTDAQIECAVKNVCSGNSPKSEDVRKTTFIADRYAITLARYIAEHEPERVDLLLVEAREVVGAFAEQTTGYEIYASDYRCGQRDSDSEMRVAVLALRRGMELEREKSQ